MFFKNSICREGSGIGIKKEKLIEIHEDKIKRLWLSSMAYLSLKEQVGIALQS